MMRAKSLSEWAIRHLKFPVSEGTADEPGLLLVQIDGLSRKEAERAISKDHMPFLASLLKKSYRMRTFYPGLPSTTPAVQAEFMYGVKAGVPAFSFRDADGKMGSMFDPSRARAYEEKFSARGRGLLEGGSSWSNIYSGGAAESHFCITNIGIGDAFRGKRWLASAFFALLHLPSMLRVAGLGVLELALGISDMIYGVFLGQRVHLEFAAMMSRMCVGIGMREFLRIGGKLDVTRGLRIVHLNFLGYDEMAHRRGPDSGFARWSLRGIDDAIRDLHERATASERRKYRVWVFSDHGQEHAKSFETRYPGGTHALVKDCLFPNEKEGGYRYEYPMARPFSRRIENRRKVGERGAEKKPFALAGMGPVAHIYFPEEISGNEKARRAQLLAEKVPAVVHLDEGNQIVWNDCEGTAKGRGAIAERLKEYPEKLSLEIAEDLERLCRHECAGHLVMLGYRGRGEFRTFAAERGAHAGLGPHELGGFLLAPGDVMFPGEEKGFVRPSALREEAFRVIDASRGGGEFRYPDMDKKSGRQPAREKQNMDAPQEEFIDDKAVPSHASVPEKQPKNKRENEASHATTH